MSFNSNRSRQKSNAGRRSNAGPSGKFNKPQGRRASGAPESSDAKQGKYKTQGRFQPRSEKSGAATRPFRSGTSDASPQKPFARESGRPKRFDKSSSNKFVGAKPSFSGQRGESENFPKKKYHPSAPGRQSGDTRTKKQTRFRKTDKSGAFSVTPSEETQIRLNRYIANAGVCSRRKADELIQAGVITVNGEVVTSLGTRVDSAKDDVRYNGERLKREKMVYVLLNKPKDYITTTDDPQERKTVMHLVEKSAQERIYPVGRLDRNTTGLLLMTNDGALAEKLSHPRNNITKIYHVELDKAFTQGDLNKLRFGIELEDGPIKPDDVSYVQGASKREVGIQIHSGKNRIVRRIFESLGYTVVKLDRAVYANLTKKDLPRGRWRYLEEREVLQLKHFIK